MNGLGFVGWGDHDKKKTPHEKLHDALALHREKRGTEANHCLTSILDALALGQPDGVRVEGRPYIAKNIFYVEEEVA
jgi:hypothetical protein